jgi:hypothetical protein
MAVHFNAENAEDLLQTLFEEAAGLGLLVDPICGLLHYLLTDAEWRAHAPNIDGNNIRPRPNFVDPGPSATGATAVIIANDNAKRQQYNVTMEASMKFRLRVLALLTPADRTRLGHHLFGMGQVTLLEVVTFVRNEYCLVTGATITELQNQVLAPMGDTETFVVYAARLSHILDQLRRHGQVYGPNDLYKKVCKAISSREYIASAAADFQKLNPMWPQQTFPLLRVYLERQEPNFPTLTSATVFGAAHQTAMPVPSTADQLAAAVSKAYARGIADAQARQAKHAPREQSRPVRDAKRYCYHHGNGHSGSHCRHMRICNEEATGQKPFTEQMINATCPTDVKGGAN